MVNESQSVSRLVRFEKIFRENLQIIYLEIENESASHSGHYDGDGESHWRVLIVADNFKDQARVLRHQLVNDLVKDEFSAGLHALTLQLFDASEWEKKKQNHFDQP